MPGETHSEPAQAPMSENASFVFSGRLQTDVFLEFARHRAARLDLAIDIGAVSDEAIALTVHGPSELVDAFEMACSLGPYQCLVLDVTRHSGLAA
jgi:acylphosphatase